MNNRLHDLDDPVELSFTAAQIMGRVLRVDRAGYGTLDEAGDILTVERDWTASGFSSAAGQHRMDSYGFYIADLRRGEVVVIDDTDRDPRTANFGKLSLEAYATRALINLPLIERGHLVALFFVNARQPRSWAPEDSAFIRSVAAYTRAASERRRAEQELHILAKSLEQRVQERTNELDRLWNTSEDFLVLCGYDGELFRVSPSWTRVLGYSEETLLKTSYMNFIHPDDAAVVKSKLGELLSNGRPVRYENRIAASDGSWRWVEWSLVSVPGRSYINAVGRDVTAEKEQAAALLKAEEALRQSQKMEAVGQLTGGLAHDFNNLLTGVIGGLELMQIRISQGRIKDLDRYVESAHGAAKRAAALTHRLLAFSRRQTLDPKPTDVNLLVRGMQELIQRTVGPEITLEPMVGSGGLWPTLVDPGQLENALLNLCINARDAMPNGGKITIETGNCWLDVCTAIELELPSGQYVSLCVSDTGTGMTPEVIAKAFDPFFTTKPIGLGTGLGLSMIYGFAKQSGGQVRIYSEINQGTMVSIYLPRHLDDGETIELAPELASRTTDGQIVLVVDDEPTVRMLVTEVLEDLGYTAIEASDGAAGLKVLQSDARIDLLVTDVGLPGGLNGRQVADAARVLRPNLKVLFITGYAEKAVVSHGHLDAGMRVLTKPFAMEALAGIIKDLVVS